MVRFSFIQIPYEKKVLLDGFEEGIWMVLVLGVLIPSEKVLLDGFILVCGINTLLRSS